MNRNLAPNQNSEKRDGLYTNTHWSKVLGARAGSESDLNWLFMCYDKPLYVHVRGLGYDHHKAEATGRGSAFSFRTKSNKQSPAKRIGNRNAPTS